MAVAAESGLAGGEQIWWLDRLDSNLANIRAALTWALATGQSAAALETVGSIWRYLSIRSDRQEGRRWLNDALQSGDQISCAERVTALRAAALLAEDQGELAETRRFLSEGLKIAETLGLQHRTCQLLSDLGNVAHDSGDFATADNLHIRANQLAIEIGFAFMIIVTFTNLGMSAYHRGDVHEASSRWKQALAHTETPEQKAILFECLGSAELDLGNFEAAIAYEEDAIGIWRRLDSRKGMADSLGIIATAHHWLGDPVADREIDETIDFFRQIGDRRGFGNALRTRASFALDRGDLLAARRDLSEGMVLSIDADDPVSVLEHLEIFARYHVLSGDHERALLILSACDAQRQQRNASRVPIKARVVEEMRTDLRRNIDVSRFASLEKQGRVWTIDETVAIALGT
jgi:tetratricopeptide (TPR) repeat protein